MKKPCFMFLVACLASTVMLADHRTAAAATIEILATGATKWSSGGASSGGLNAPLLVKAAKGDVLQITLTGGTHGFVTLDKPGNQTPSPKLDLVQACGENKPDAVFREMECGSQFNKQLGMLKLEVTDKFQGEVHFWCIFHKSGMWGTIQPQ
jgi:plastocyanin